MTSIKCLVADNRKVISSLLLAVGIIALFCILNSASAGTEGKEFNEVYDKIVGWLQGSLGKVMAVTCVGVGLAFTVTRGTLTHVVVGIAMCLILYNAPTVIDDILTATVNADVAFDAVKTTVNNGLLK